MHARGRRILLLNPDTVILDHAIDRLYAFAEAHPDCGIWGGRTVFSDGRLNPTSCWRGFTLWSIFCFTTGLTRMRRSGLFNPEGYGGWQRDSARAVDIVTGCFFLIDRALWERCQGFDPAFFMYGEEADLCIRARHFGARPMMTPDATIIHYGGASEPDRAEQRIKVLASRISLMRRHRSASFMFAARPLELDPAVAADRDLRRGGHSARPARSPTLGADLVSRLAQPCALDRRLERRWCCMGAQHARRRDRRITRWSRVAGMTGKLPARECRLNCVS